MADGVNILGGQLIVLSEEAAGTAPQHSVDVSVTYNPRRHWTA